MFPFFKTVNTLPEDENVPFPISKRLLVNHILYVPIASASDELVMV
jgi:hypothetical protein